MTDRDAITRAIVSADWARSKPRIRTVSARFITSDCLVVRFRLLDDPVVGQEAFDFVLEVTDLVDDVTAGQLSPQNAAAVVRINLREQIEAADIGLDRALQSGAIRRVSTTDS